jgi:hypothetical protein
MELFIRHAFLYPLSSRFLLVTDLSNTSGEDQKFEDDKRQELRNPDTDRLAYILASTLAFKEIWS